MLTIIKLLLQLRVLQQEAAPQAANQWATLLEWEVYSPTSVNLAIGITASHRFIQINLPFLPRVYHNICSSTLRLYKAIIFEKKSNWRFLSEYARKSCDDPTDFGLIQIEIMLQIK